ncbi:hypothetical protein ACO0K9_16360 [Undibacterium sp. Ji50W]|uniref:hypothetical protein n=1 Tax=Undibacterium sp. Ji50W TaxID=3413041 RepID=UPI003BF024C5
MRERPISAVPKPVLLLLALSFFVQISWFLAQPPHIAKAEDLMPAPSLSTLKISSFGEPIAMAKGMMLYLQAFDNQAGHNLSFQQLDYIKLETWLTRILELDPAGQYPLFAASRLYGEISDENKQRRMLDFVYRQFLVDPNRRWKSMTHAVLLARHRLHDMPLARKYAHAILLHATSSDVPGWAKQMEIFLLEDMNELQSAKILLGGLLQSGQITDKYEYRFLEQRLTELEQKIKMNP